MSDYFKNYYQKNREHILFRVKSNYYNNKSLYNNFEKLTKNDISEITENFEKVEIKEKKKITVSF